jgi:hypothetical protein
MSVSIVAAELQSVTSSAGDCGGVAVCDEQRGRELPTATPPPLYSLAYADVC